MERSGRTKVQLAAAERTTVLQVVCGWGWGGQSPGTHMAHEPVRMYRTLPVVQSLTLQDGAASIASSAVS